MPLTRYEIRNEYGLANRELYRTAQKNDPQGILQGVAMVGLVGIVRQLGDLAEFAAEIFHDLHEEVTATAARSHDLVARVIQLEAELPILEKSLLSEMNQLQFAYTPGIEWHASIRNDQNHCTQGDLPRFIRSSYEECRGPPRLFLLDKFDVAGAGACLKRYTDPSFFKMEWASGELMKAEKAQLEKKTRRGKKRGKRHRSEMKERMATRSAAQMPTRARFSSLSTSSLDGLSEGTTPKSLPGTTQMEASPKQPILENENQENIIKMNAGGEHFRKFEKLEESQKHLETLMDASRLSLALGTKPMKTNSEEPASMPKEFENFTHASRLSLGLETKPIKASSEEPARIPVEDLESGNGSLQAELERDCKPERETEEVVANVDDAASEGDNFVDALTYMESETDSESRERQRLVSSEIRPVVTSFGSDTDSEPEAVQSSNGQHPSEIRPTVASFDSDTDSELAHDSIPQHPLEIRPAVTSFNEDSDLDMQAAQGSTSQYPFPVSHPSSDSDSRMSDSGRSPGRSELKQHSNDDLFVKSMEISNANGIMEAKSAEEGLRAFASDPGHLAGAPRLDQGANGTSIRNAAIAQDDVSGSGSDTSEAGSTSEDTGDFDGQSGESDAEIGATHWELSSDDEDYIARHMLNNSNIHSLKQQSPVVEAENSTNVTDLPESDSDSITPIVLAIETMTVITQDASARSIDGTSQSGVKMLSQYHNDERMRDDGFDVSEMDLQLRTMEIFETGLTPSAENNELDLQAIPKEVGGPQEDHMALSPESGYKHENEEPVGSLDTEKGIVSSIEGVDISKDNPYLQDGDPQDDATMEKMGSVSREVSGQSLSGKAGTEPSKPYTEFSLLENISKAFEAHKTVECTTSPESADQYATQPAESTSTNDNFMHSELSLQNETGVNARPIQSSMDKKEGTASNTLVFQKSGHVREDYMNEDCLKGSTGSFDLADTSTYEQSEQARSPPVGQTLFNPNESIQPEVDAIDVKKVDEHEMIPLRISTMPTSDTSSSSLSTPRYLESPVYDYRNGQLSPASSQLSPDLSPKSPVFSALLSPLSPGKASVPLPKFLENQGNQIAGMAQADYAAISSSPPLEAMPPLPPVSFRKASMPLPNFVETQSNQTAAMAQADVSISSSPPSLPPLPPLKWRNMQSPTMQSPTQVGSPTIPSPPNLPGKPLGVLQKFPLSRPLLKDERSDALVESISLHDRSKLKKVVTQPRSPRPRVLDDREVLLEQIRNKSFSLKRTVVQKQATPSRPIANINVAAILEKANAIRQAFVGSDEDDDDNWSDA